MEFLVTDYKGRNYKIDCVEDNEECLWCMVYRGLGIGANPYDYGEMEYEDDYSADFCIHIEDVLELDDEMQVEYWIKEHFNNVVWFEDNIGEVEEAEISNLDMIENVLDRYYSLDLNKMLVADALAELTSVSEEMAKVLEKIMFDTKIVI